MFEKLCQNALQVIKNRGFIPRLIKYGLYCIDLILVDTDLICICILIALCFISSLTVENEETDIWFIATDNSASSASGSQHQRHKLTNTQTHKQTLTASSDASSCYRDTNTNAPITSAYTAAQRHRLRRHVTSGTELTRGQMRARAKTALQCSLSQITFSFKAHSVYFEQTTQIN